VASRLSRYGYGFLTVLAECRIRVVTAHAYKTQHVKYEVEGYFEENFFKR
jgi:hypothetical protein